MAVLQSLLSMKNFSFKHGHKSDIKHLIWLQLCLTMCQNKITVIKLGVKPLCTEKNELLQEFGNILGYKAFLSSKKNPTSQVTSQVPY